MAQPLLTMSAKGVIRDPQEKASWLLAYYLTSNYSQSNIFRGSILSLPKRIQEFDRDVEDLRSKLREDIENLLRPYFDDVSCLVTTSFPEKDDPRAVNATVEVIFTEAGERYSLGRVISVAGNKAFHVMSINNTGIAP